jgi:FtsZ-binding cell division protein ZapB
MTPTEQDEILKETKEIDKLPYLSYGHHTLLSRSIPRLIAHIAEQEEKNGRLEAENKQLIEKLDKFKSATEAVLANSRLLQDHLKTLLH